LGIISEQICGDFNATQSKGERLSFSLTIRFFDNEPFNRFIEDIALVDHALCGRRYTWHQGDGQTMSRLDRFLLSEEWGLIWLTCIQMAQSRGLLDHCLLMLSIDEENWGPRPFCMLKCWANLPGYKQFVSKEWRSFQVVGWAGY